MPNDPTLKPYTCRQILGSIPNINLYKILVEVSEKFQSNNNKPLFQVKVDSEEGKPQFEIELKYTEGQPVIREIKRVSTPGRRVYSGMKDLPRVYNGLGISILSTPSGVMSDIQARKKNVGGEVLCQVF